MVNKEQIAQAFEKKRIEVAAELEKHTQKLEQLIIQVKEKETLIANLNKDIDSLQIKQLDLINKVEKANVELEAVHNSIKEKEKEIVERGNLIKNLETQAATIKEKIVNEYKASLDELEKLKAEVKTNENISHDGSKESIVVWHSNKAARRMGRR